MKKKIVTFLLCIGMVSALLAGCGEKNEKDTTDETTAQESNTDESTAQESNTDETVKEETDTNTDDESQAKSDSASTDTSGENDVQTDASGGEPPTVKMTRDIKSVTVGTEVSPMDLIVAVVADGEYTIGFLLEDGTVVDSMTPEETGETQMTIFVEDSIGQKAEFPILVQVVESE